MSEDARRILREKAGTRFEEVLPSGLRVTIRLPKVRDAIRAGRVPLPILSHIGSLASNGEVPEVSLEDVEGAGQYQDEMVRLGVVEIEGNPIEMTLEDVREFSQADYDRIVELCQREANPTQAGSSE